MRCRLLLMPYGCVAQLVEQRSPKSPVGGSNPSALDVYKQILKVLRVAQIELKFMENPKNSSHVNAYASLKKAFRRFEDLKVEFKKIQWTEEKKPQEYAKVVVLATFFCGMLLYCADVVVHKSLWLINALLRFLFG